MELQSGLRMIAFTSPVTYACPLLTRAGGWSLTAWLGVIHETDGSVPRFAAFRNESSGAMSASCWSCFTSVNHGSGFQIPGVFAFCGTALQSISSSAQSGCEPLST